MAPLTGTGWERVELEAHERRREGAVRIDSHQGARRVTVMGSDFIGRAAGPADLCTPGDLIDRALRHIRRSLPYTDGGNTAPAGSPTSSDLRGLPWAVRTGHEQIHVRYKLTSSDGRSLDGGYESEWQRLSVGGRTLARIPVDAPDAGLPFPAANGGQLLLPPWALAQMLLEPALQALASGLAGEWAAVDLIDPAWGGGTDLEGTVRTAIRFTAAGTTGARPSDRYVAAISGQPLTGHAGLAGPHVRDLVVEAGAECAPWPSHADVVTSAACLASSDGLGRDALIALELGGCGGASILRLAHLTELLALGRWCGPWQRGAGAWTSRWLLIEGADEWMSQRRM
jgi:hypothetical protein